MKRLVAVALLVGLFTGSVGLVASEPQDLTTLLSYFLRDLYSGSLGTYAGITNVTLATGGAVRTGTTSGNTAKLQAYDVDGGSFADLLVLTAGNTPSMTGVFGAGSAAVPSVALGSRVGLYVGGGGTALTIAIDNYPYYSFGTNNLIVPGSLSFTDNDDTRLSRESAAVLQLGGDVNGSAIAQTIKAHDGITGTDIAGANFILAGGRGTGAGAPGQLIFQTATELGSGTTAQTLATRLIIGATGAATLGTTAGTGAGAFYAGSYYVGTTAGADCTSAAAVTVAKGIVTGCSEPLPDPLTADEISELRGLLSANRTK